MELIQKNKVNEGQDLMENHIAQNSEMTLEEMEDRTPEQIKQDENTEETNLYSIKDFSI